MLTFPSIQTQFGKKATQILNNDYNVSIHINKLDFSNLGQVHLKNVFIKDHHQDTLIYVHDLATSLISYRNILNNKMAFGTISLSNFKLYVKTYKGEQDDALSIFSDKFDEGKPATKPSGFLLTANKLKFKQGKVVVFDENVDAVPIIFKQISGYSNNFKIEGPNVSTQIEKLAFIENHKLKIKNLSTDFAYTKKFMQFENLLLQTKNSKIRGTLRFDYNRSDFSDFNNKVKLNAVIKDAAISAVDLKHFYKEFSTKEVFKLSTDANGVLNNLNFTNFILKGRESLKYEGALNLVNSFNLKNGFSFNSDFKNVSFKTYYLKELFPHLLKEQLPNNLDQLQAITLTGSTKIEENEIYLNVHGNSSLGNFLANLNLTNIDDNEKAKYDGEIGLLNFNLGKLIDKSSIGLVTLHSKVSGKGFLLKAVEANTKGKIASIQYNDYTYKNLFLNGAIKKERFNGNLEVNDNNIKLNFNGLADFSSAVNQFKFNAIIDYCDLNAIKLYTADKKANVKGELKIDIKGNEVDNLIGTVRFNNFLFTNSKDNYFFKDFNITSLLKDSVKTVKINSSEIINGNLHGKFKFSELLNITRNSIGSIYTNYKPLKVSPKQQIDFNFKIYNKIIEIFYPDISLGANTVIKGKINADDNLFRLTLKSPQIIAYHNNIDKVKLQIDNKNPFFNTQLLINQINSKYYHIHDFKLINVTLNDTLFFKSKFTEGDKLKEDFNLSFYHTFNKKSESVFGMKSSNFTYKNKSWVINGENNKNNKINYNYKSGEWQILPFEIASKQQKINFYGSLKKNQNNLHFNFKNVQLANVTPKIDSLKLKGLINGNINYTQIDQQIRPTANFNIDNFEINHIEEGHLNVDINGDNSITKYLVNINLKDKSQQTFSAKGGLDFSPEKPTINMKLLFEKFKLNAFSPLGEDVFTNFKGDVYGEVALTGAIENPAMEGDLFLDGAGLYFPYLNVNYNFKGTSIINLKNQTFNFEDVTLNDTSKNTSGKLTGSLSHHNFENWKLNLNINSRNILVLNTKQKENSLYFGTGFLGGNAKIYGPTDNLVIDVVGKTNKGTHFVIPISDVKTVESNQLIRFVNRSKSQDKIKQRNEFISEKLKGLSINFDLDVTKDAVVEMVLDKATGSYLKGSGHGNLQINLDTKDKFDMYGDFYVDNGVYNFKYGGFINKPFTVKKGGSISWSGNPYTADINLEAIYKVNANPKSLLENITTNRKIPINLITRFSGELFNSKRSFDIEIPNSSSTVASELAFKLNSNDNNTKTIHFISLLVSGSFYNENDITVNSNAALYGTGFDMLSNAFDNIFNKADSKFKLKPVYTVGEKNKIDNLNINDQLALALDYQVNDRILINGKVGVPIGSKKQSNVIGEVNIEFLLNQEGTLRSSIFNRQNEIQYTEEEEGYTQGVGLNYQIDFDTGKELLQKLGLKKKKVKDTLKVVNKLDTLATQSKLLKFKNKLKKNE
ncbi:MAG: translocation/assembly module TamB domain-containing protein [Lutibacter sp.]